MPLVNPLPALLRPVEEPLYTVTKCNQTPGGFRKLADLFVATVSLAEASLSYPLLTSEAKAGFKFLSDAIKNGDYGIKLIFVIRDRAFTDSPHGLLSNVLSIYVFAQKHIAPQTCAHLNAATVSFLTHVAQRTGNQSVMGVASFVTGLGVDKIAKGATILFLLIEVGKGAYKLYYNQVTQNRTLHEEWKVIDLALKVPCILLPYTSVSTLAQRGLGAVSAYVSIVALATEPARGS